MPRHPCLLLLTMLLGVAACVDGSIAGPPEGAADADADPAEAGPTDGDDLGGGDAVEGSDLDAEPDAGGGDAMGGEDAPPPDVAADAPDVPPAVTCGDGRCEGGEDPQLCPQDCPPASCATSCAELGAECGSIDNGCGTLLQCPACPAYTGCGLGGAPNRCAPPACVPTAADSTNGGGRCGELNQAWTARGINVGYYPYRVTAPIPQYSGDYTGDPNAIFTPGPARAGVILQMIPAGAYVGLSSVGPWYDPPSGCFPEGESCGAAFRSACRPESAPPLRPGVGGFHWGYAYQGASHMQGWIYYDPTRLEFAGFDPGHPCARGPAGVDYEIPAACGQPTTCAGDPLSCSETNKCDEGQDDCGRTECGAASGSALTPTAHRKRVRRPPGDHACAQRTPPHASVTCLENGADRDFFFVYPFGAYLYWAQNSTTKAWLHYGDQVQSYYHTRDAQGVLWDFVEVLQSGAAILTPPSDGAGAGGACSSSNPGGCTPCQSGGTCGWIQAVFLE